MTFPTNSLQIQINTWTHPPLPFLFEYEVNEALCEMSIFVTFFNLKKQHLPGTKSPCSLNPSFGDYISYFMESLSICDTLHRNFHVFLNQYRPLESMFGKKNL